MKKITRRNFLKATGTIAAAGALAACGGSSSSAPASTPASTAASVAAPAVEWPGNEKDIIFYSRNNAGSSVSLAQQYLMDIVFDGVDATALLTCDATSGGAVCVEKTYAAGGDGYTFYMSGVEMVIGDVLGTFEYSLKDDFTPLGMIPTNGASNYLCVSKSTMPDVTTLEQFTDYCKAHPGEVRIGYGPDTIGEVLLSLLFKKLGVEVKWTISEGNDSTTNIMGGITDAYLFNQAKTLELMGEYVTPLVGASTMPNTKPELEGVPNYTDLGLEECSVPSYMFLAVKNDIDPALAQVINEKWNAAIEDALSANPSDRAKVLADHMATQNQMLKPLTIEECWDIINTEYEAISAVLGE